MKRKLSLVLVFVLILGVISSGAYAAGSMMNILPSIASNPDWKYVDIFYDGYAAVEFHDGTRGYIDPYGEFSQEKPAEPYDMSGFTSYEEPRLVIMGDEYFFVDREGRILLQALEEAQVFSGGVAAAKRDGVWYIVDANTLVQNAQLYDEAFERVLASDFLERAGIDRADIIRIDFEGSTMGANETSWDASAEGNGRVIAYITNGNNLHISSDGGVVADIDLSYLFAGCANLEEIYYNGWFDTSETQYVEGMFEGCGKLADLKLHELDLSRVRDLDKISNAAAGEEPEQEAPVQEEPAVAPVTNPPYVPSGEGGTLMAESVEGNPYDEQNVFYTGISKDSIKRIEFYDSLNAIAGDEVFDVSEEQNGSVMAAVEDGVLRIGADGPVYAPADSNYLFSEYRNVESIEFNGCLDTSRVETMSWMFEGCRKLKSLDLSGFDTSNVYDMSFMFCGCTKVKHLNLFFFDTSNVRDMRSMFASCAEIEELDLSGFNTSNVESMRNMFDSCRKLSNLILGEGFDVSRVSDYEGIFDNCPKINHSWESITGGGETVPVGEGGTLMPKSAEPITFSSDEMVYTSGVLKEEISRIVFHSSLDGFGDGSMDVSEEQNGSVLAMIEGDVLHIGANGIVRAPKDSSKLFKDYSNVYSFEFNGCFDTSGAEDMSEMFARCSALGELDLGSFNTAGVRNMASMFMGCANLRILNLNSFNTARVEDMGSMFSGCAAIERLDLSSFTTGRLKTMVYMFNGCRELVDLDVSNFDVRGVTNNYEVFAGCEKLNMTWEELASKSSASSSDAATAPEPQPESGYSAGMGGTLMRDETEHDGEGIINVDEQYVFSTDIRKADVSEIVFHDNFSALGANAFDVSEEQNGSVLAWMDGSVLNIAADGPVYAPADSSNLFLGYQYTYAIRFNGCFDTSRTESMRSMFDCCHGLQELDLSGFDTSNVYDMTGMFGDCHELTSLDLSNFDTANTEYMNWMFYDCFKLSDLNISSFNTARVQEMKCMFMNCHELRSLDLPGFTADSLQDMREMFMGCENLAELNIPNFHVAASAVQDGAFDGCESLNMSWEDSDSEETVPSDGRNVLMREDLEGSTGEVQYIFDTGIPKAGITRIEIISELDAVAGDIYDVSQNKDGSVLAGIDGSLLHIGADGTVFAPEECFSLFGQYPDLEEINFNGCFNTSAAVDMLCMFEGNKKLRRLDLSGFNTSNVECMEAMFQSCQSLESIDLTGFDTSKVGSMGGMFTNCDSLTKLDLSSFTADGAYDMQGMFRGCYNLEHIDISALYVNDSIMHEGIFDGCDKLDLSWEDLPGAGQGGDIGLMRNEDADLISGADYIFGHPEYKRADVQHIRMVNSLDMFSEDDMDISESKNGTVRAKIEDGVLYIGAKNIVRAPENCSWLFSNYPNLETIDLGCFNTSRVTDMTEMFSGNPKLREISTGYFETWEVTSMANMFAGCKSLEYVPVYSFYTGNVESMYGMFYDCDSLREVNISEFNLENVGDMSYMFASCDNLENVQIGDSRPGDGCQLYGFFDDYAYMGVTWDDLFGDGGANPFANVYLTIGSSGEEVRLVQQCLIDMGYLTGSADGQYGNMTANAVRVYQQVNSYAQTGAVDAALYEFFYHYMNAQQSAVEYETEISEAVAGILMDEYSEGESEEDDPDAFNTGILKNDVIRIEFVDSLAGFSGNAYDVSQAQDGGVLAEFRDGVLTIGANGGVLAPQNCKSLFYKYENLQEINFNGCFDTSMVQQMGYMFSYCESLVNMDLSDFNTENVRNMRAMFQNTPMEVYDLSSFDTRNVEEMSWLFNGCDMAKHINVTSFDTSGATDMTHMFAYCTQLTELDLSSFDTSNVTKMNSMFELCYDLENLILSEKFDVSRVEEYENIFVDCNHLDLRWEDLPGSSAAAPADAGTRVMRPADEDSEYAFGTDIRKEEVTSIVFADTRYSTTGTIFDVSKDRDESVLAIFTRDGAMHIGAEGGVIAPESCRKLFEDFPNLTSISFNGNFDTSATADMSFMFSGCEKLTQADFNTLNTENVFHMAGMFRSTSLEEYDLSAFDTRNVEDMYAMFDGCNDARYINVSSFDTSAVEDMAGMFGYCESLQTLDLSGFNTAQVRNIHSMFYGCTNLSSVELGDGWDTGNVRDFDYMFANCAALTELDIENFEFYSLETMEGILDNCPNYRYSTELLFVMVASGEIGFGLNGGSAEIQEAEEESIHLYHGCGDRENVVRIQQALINMGYLNGAADGQYGNMTANAVSAFQNDHGLTANGEVDTALYNMILDSESSAAEASESEASSEVPMRGYGMGMVTLLVPSMDNLYYLTIIEGVQHAAEEYGLDLEIITSGYDAQMQLVHLEMMAAMGTEALFICPVNEEVSMVAEELAADCGIPLFLFDGNETYREETFHLVHDDYRGGSICGEEYAKAHPQGGKVPVVSASSQHEERLNGFFDAVAAAGVNVEEISIHSENHSEEECTLMLVELLLNEGNISAIFCCSETEAQAAVRACEITGREMPIYAVGGSEEMKTLVEQGKIDTIAAQSPLAMGRIAVDLYGSWLYGENSAGEYRIDYLMINSETLGNYGVAGWQ